jgi:hypothetical protein
MHTSARSAFLHCSRTTSVTSRTAVYGPVRTVVWQGSAGDCRPYADQVVFWNLINCSQVTAYPEVERQLLTGFLIN